MVVVVAVVSLSSKDRLTQINIFGRWDAFAF